MTIAVSSTEAGSGDLVLPFRLDRPGARGRLVRLGASLDAVFAHRTFPPAISTLTAEAVLITALIGHAIKLRWKLSLQIRGDGPVRLIATDYVAPSNPGEAGRLRAYAGFDETRVEPDARPGLSLLGQGYFAVVIDQGTDTRPYQGISPLSGRSLAESAETFFQQSEQLPTRLRVAVSDRAPSCGNNGPSGSRDGPRGCWQGGGLMLQRLPDAGTGTAESPVTPLETPEHGFRTNGAGASRPQEAPWSRLGLSFDSVSDSELIEPSLPPDQLVFRRFGSERPQVSTASPVAFGCSCSPETVRRSLSIYSARDILTMVNDDGMVTADCQFCGAHYEFAPETLGFEAVR